MPTADDISALIRNCDWTWTQQNGASGYIVRGRVGYTSASIFLPCAGNGYWTSLRDVGSYGYYWSSVPNSDIYSSRGLYFYSDYHYADYDYLRRLGVSVRPVQGFTK